MFWLKFVAAPEVGVPQLCSRLLVCVLVWSDGEGRQRHVHTHVELRGANCIKRSCDVCASARTRYSAGSTEEPLPNAALEAVDAAVQFNGVEGLAAVHPLEDIYREVSARWIYEGASEIQREIIARRLLRTLEGAPIG
ncbi:MAG: hypothetical protein JO372_24245 [Solirubrobacterales bacterium]|nr:hypothetical protein [Solirubrobacterales bacterium]